GRVERGTQLLQAVEEQIVLVPEVRVEGRPTDVGAVDDVLHRDLGVPLLEDLRDQRASQRFPGPPDPPVDPFAAHPCPPSGQFRESVQYRTPAAGCAWRPPPPRRNLAQSVQ